jgi:hypothetical protein
MQFKMLVSALPLTVAVVVTGIQWSERARPSVCIGETAVQIATAPWQPQQHVSFTDTAENATVRVQIVDSPETADFAVIDDVDTQDAESCGVAGAAEYVSIIATGVKSDPVIYLSHDEGGDYRIYVRSRHFSEQEAAALVVSSGRNHPHQAAASL